MLTAVVYSIETLNPEVKGAISDGLDVLGQYVGGVSIMGFKQLRLPTDENGEVSTRFACRDGFDTLTALHIFANPMRRGNEVESYTGGIAYKNTGVAHVDPRSSRKLLQAIATHEAAHSIGYVLEDAPQSLGDRAHCSDPGCVMHASIVEAIDDPEFVELNEMLKSVGSRLLKNAPELARLINQVDDFCLPCRADIRDTHEEQLGRIIQRRLYDGAVLTADQIRAASVN